MTGFSADWLALREPADLRARDQALLAGLGEHFSAASSISIADLGCGTGSNLRAMAHAFPAHAIQHWLLLDHDEALLNEARQCLTAWADEAVTEGDGLKLQKDGRALSVSFATADLAAPDAAQLRADIITAAAFFDLTSRPWIGNFARALQTRAVYAALNYDGVELWSPPHPADGPMLAAFHAHQSRDKGFGPAAGPQAAEALKQALEEAGYVVKQASTPWRLSRSTDTALIETLAAGSAAAIAELNYFDAGAIEDWRSSRCHAASCVIGHTDMLALKAE